jgi:hypothetical protein
VRPRHRMRLPRRGHRFSKRSGHQTVAGLALPAWPRPCSVSGILRLQDLSFRPSEWRRQPVLLNVTMRSQWGSGFGLFVDLNGGWYSQIAALDSWASSLGLSMPANPNHLLPHSRAKSGFSPGNEGDELADGLSKPASTAAWETP